MAEARVNKGVQKNPTSSDSVCADGRILSAESDLLKTRLNELFGDESVSSFARRCGVGESTLRNILNGAMPRTDVLVAIANAGGVTVDWLATGRPPKFRRDLVAQSAPERPPAPKINAEALAHAYAVTLQTAPKGETLEQSARKAVAFYQYCWDQGLITEDGEGNGNLHGAA